MNPILTVRLTLPWGPEYTACKQLSGDMVRRTYAPVDHATPNADPIVALLFCTPPAHMRVVTKLRADFADRLGREIAAEILKQMGERDTLMGDPPSVRQPRSSQGGA